MSIFINNGAGEPAKSLRISSWRWIGYLCRFSFCSHWSLVDVTLISFCPAAHVPDWQPRIVLGMVEARSVNVKKTTTTTQGGYGAGAFLYNIETRTSIISLERCVCPPGAKGRPLIDSFKRRSRVLEGSSFRNTRARPQGSRVEKFNIYIYTKSTCSRVHVWRSVYIDGQRIGARYSELSMDGINKHDLFSPDKNHPVEGAHRGVRILHYLMADEPIRAGGGQGLTEQNIQAPDLRT